MYKERLLEILAEKKSSQSKFRKSALQMLNVNKPYDLLTILYDRKDIESAKILVEIFPRLMFDGGFRIDVLSEKMKTTIERKNHKNKYLTKDFFKFLKDINAIGDDGGEELLRLNKITKRKATDKTSYIKVFPYMDESYNLDFMFDLVELGYRLNKHDITQQISVLNSESELRKYQQKVMKNFSENDSSIGVLISLMERKKYSTDFVKTLGEILISSESKGSSLLESINHNTIGYGGLSISNRLYLSLKLVESGFNKQDVVNKIDGFGGITGYIGADNKDIQKAIEFGFDINFTNENNSFNMFWYEKLLSNASINFFEELIENNGLNFHKELSNGKTVIEHLNDKFDKNPSGYDNKKIKETLSLIKTITEKRELSKKLSNNDLFLTENKSKNRL